MLVVLKCGKLMFRCFFIKHCIIIILWRHCWWLGINSTLETKTKNYSKSFFSFVGIFFRSLKMSCLNFIHFLNYDGNSTNIFYIMKKCCPLSMIKTISHDEQRTWIPFSLIINFVWLIILRCPKVNSFISTRIYLSLKIRNIDVAEYLKLNSNPFFSLK